MKSGRTTLGFATPPFRNTQRLHLPTTKGDSAAGIRACQHKPAGPDHVKCLDYNTSVVKYRNAQGETKYIIHGAHWSRFRMNGYTLWRDKQGHYHKIKGKQRFWTYQQWVDHYKGAAGGPTQALHMLYRPNGDPVQTWVEAVGYAKRCGVVLTPELKSVLFALNVVAEQFVNVCKTRDYPCWPMALLKMRRAKEKCHAIIKAGGYFALIFGKFRSQARGENKVRDWPTKPTVIWGPKTARQWLRS